MRMPTIAFGLLVWSLSALCAAEDVDGINAVTATSTVLHDRLLLPHDFARGYAEFNVAPPHNELDLGLCDPGMGPASGPGACAAYARFIWSGYLEVQPFGRTPLRRLFLIWEPKLFGGETMPQNSYTASPALILMEQSLGAGISMPRNFELRVMHHHSTLLGRYGATPSAITLHGDGPYGLYTTVGVRWSFGGYGGTHAPR